MTRPTNAYGMECGILLAFAVVVKGASSSRHYSPVISFGYAVRNNTRAVVGRVEDEAIGEDLVHQSA